MDPHDFEEEKKDPVTTHYSIDNGQKSKADYFLTGDDSDEAEGDAGDDEKLGDLIREIFDDDEANRFKVSRSKAHIKMLSRFLEEKISKLNLRYGDPNDH